MSNFRVPFFVGNTSGRDHGIVPTIDRDGLNNYLIGQGFTDTDARHRAIDQSFPIGINLETYMQLTWRVRQWGVIGGSFNYTGVKGGGFEWDMSAAWPAFTANAKRVKVPPDDDEPFRDVTDERDLLGPSTDSGPDTWDSLRNAGIMGDADEDDIVVSATDTDSGPETGVDGVVHPQGFFDLQIFGDYTIFDPDTGLFYPRMFIDGVFQCLADNRSVFLGTTGTQVSLQLLSTDPIAPPLPAPPTGLAFDVQQGTLTLSGFNGEADMVIPIGAKGQAAGSAQGSHQNGAVDGSIDIEMSASSWWPYRNKADTADIYDTGDGSVINDPFS